jgi:hypothetical protein
MFDASSNKCVSSYAGSCSIFNNFKTKADCQSACTSDRSVIKKTTPTTKSWTTKIQKLVCMLKNI